MRMTRLCETPTLIASARGRWCKSLVAHVRVSPPPRESPAMQLRVFFGGAKRRSRSNPLFQFRVMELLCTTAHPGCSITVVLHDLHLLRVSAIVMSFAQATAVAKGTGKCFDR
jgi:hypothetical protein